MSPSPAVPGSVPDDPARGTPADPPPPPPAPGATPPPVPGAGGTTLPPVPALAPPVAAMAAGAPPVVPTSLPMGGTLVVPPVPSLGPGRPRAAPPPVAARPPVPAGSVPEDGEQAPTRSPPTKRDFQLMGRIMNTSR